MNKIINLLSGYKTYVVGLLSISLGLLKDPIDYDLIIYGLGLMTLRAGVKKINVK